MFDNLSEVKKNYGIKDSGNWMKLKDGSNKVRIVSDFADYGIHSIKDNGKYRSEVCIGKDNGCYYCSQGSPVKVQFLGWVIDRADNQVKLLRIGWVIASQIKAYQESEEYGFKDLPPYDIDIVRSGEGLDTDYNVIPARKDTPLTPEEEEMIAKVVKDPREIIDKMKEKAKNEVLTELTSEEEPEPMVDEIPF